MYADFYGLKERPFALVPDPRYLFLSRSHREALAHLLYGIEAGEGFIEVVGQVGTGKTTLCRTLLGRVGSDVEIAYIFNPSPSDSELIAAINREFGLPTVARSRGELIDDLNRFLLEKRAQDRKVLLVIDEAQNLEPSVLEQIRLLSNLETEREKLLLIVLIGQPELEENLARSDLRQLRQRITVRWDLRPFDGDEVGQYVCHRLRVAGLEKPEELFSRGAIRALYRASRGTPRIINALADRCLLAGYSAGLQQIPAKVVRTVARELPSSERVRGLARLALPVPVAASLVFAGLVAGFLATAQWPGAFPAWRGTATPAVSAGVGALPVEAAPEMSVIPAALPDSTALPETTVQDLLAYLGERGPRVTMAGSLDALLDQWGYYAPIRGELDPNLVASAVRDISPLRVLVTRTTLPALERMNLPAILELEHAAGERRYAALLAIEPNGLAHLGVRGDVFTAGPEELQAAWTGRAFVLWANFESLPAMQPGMNGTAVRWLQARLTELGYLARGDASGEFDGATADALQRFQTELGLDDTGQVGPETLISLYGRLSYDAPRLVVADEIT